MNSMRGSVVSVHCEPDWGGGPSPAALRQMFIRQPAHRRPAVIRPMQLLNDIVLPPALRKFFIRHPAPRRPAVTRPMQLLNDIVLPPAPLRPYSQWPVAASQRPPISIAQRWLMLVQRPPPLACFGSGSERAATAGS